MANTYTSLHYHVIFSTKNRVPWITPNLESRSWPYIGGIARKHKMKERRKRVVFHGIRNCSCMAIHTNIVSKTMALGSFRRI